jgi:kinesin family protein 3/17
MRRLEKKLADARAEIDDLANEAQQERQQLLESIRDQNREMKLLEQVLGMLLPSKEMAKIWERSSYDAEADEWIVPAIKARKEFQPISLPSLGGSGGGEGGGSSINHRDEKQRKKNAKKEDGESSKPPSRARSAARATPRATPFDEAADLKPDWGFAEEERVPSRQGGSRSAQPAEEGGDVERGRIRPKSGSRSRKTGGSRPTLAPSTNNPVEPLGV